jgi:flavin-binding protein dodecin
MMWVSKTSELIGSSPLSFEDAARTVLERANRTLRGITGFEVLEKRIKVENDELREYRIRLRLTFDMASESKLHW